MAAAAAADEENKDDKASKKPRLSKWTHKEDIELCQAVLKFVNDNRGQLPPALRTGAAAKVSPGWVKIAQHTPKTAGEEITSGARACSGRWDRLRGDTSVRQTDILAYISFYCCLHAILWCLCRRR